MGAFGVPERAPLAVLSKPRRSSGEFDFVGICEAQCRFDYFEIARAEAVAAPRRDQRHGGQGYSKGWLSRHVLDRRAAMLGRASYSDVILRLARADGRWGRADAIRARGPGAGARRPPSAAFYGPLCAFVADCSERRNITKGQKAMGHASRRRLRERRVVRQFEAAPEDPKNDPRDEIAEDHRQDERPVPRQRLVSGFHKVDDDVAVYRDGRKRLHGGRADRHEQ